MFENEGVKELIFLVETGWVLYEVILSWGSKWVQVSTSLLPKNITIPVAPLERWVIFRIGGGSGVALLGATERSPFCNLHSSLDHPEDH